MTALPDIPDEAVEAAAKAEAEEWIIDGTPWEDDFEDHKAVVRERMRIALTAAAPSLMALAWDEGYAGGKTDAYHEERGRDVETENPYRGHPHHAR